MQAKIKDTIDFIDKIITNDIKTMLDNDLWYLSFVIMVSAVETLGAIIDKKPLRARAQSFKRFNLAIDKLFPSKYKNINKNGFLYDKLRNHLSHNLIQSSYLILVKTENNEFKHLSFNDKKIILAADKFYNDLTKALELAKHRLEQK